MLEFLKVDEPETKSIVMILEEKELKGSQS